MSQDKIRELTMKLVAKNQEINELKDKHDQEILALRKEMIQLRKNQVVMSKDDKYKEVLKLHAYGYSTGLIHKMLNTEMGIDMTVEEINFLTGKVETLGSELLKHYNMCKAEFKEKSVMDSGYFKGLMMKRFSLLENEMEEALLRAKMLDDEGLQVKIRDQLSNLYDKMAKSFAKNMEDTSQDGTVEDIMEGYEDSTEKAATEIIELNIGTMEVI